MTGVEVHIGEAGKRLERHFAERKAASDFAEHLRSAGVVACLGGVEERGKDDRAFAVDGVPGERGATAQSPGAELAAAIEREVIVVDGGAGAAVVDVEQRLGIAAGESEPPALLKGRVHA